MTVKMLQQVMEIMVVQWKFSLTLNGRRAI